MGTTVLATFSRSERRSWSGGTGEVSRKQLGCDRRDLPTQAGHRQQAGLQAHLPRSARQERFAGSPLDRASTMSPTWSTQLCFEKPGLIPGWQQEDQMQTNLEMMQNLSRAAGRRGRTSSR